MTKPPIYVILVKEKEKTMRVNVCYSAELEELPSIVQNLSTEVANNLRAIADSLDNGVSETLANGQTRNPPLLDHRR